MKTEIIGAVLCYRKSAILDLAAVEGSIAELLYDMDAVVYLVVELVPMKVVDHMLQELFQVLGPVSVGYNYGKLLIMSGRCLAL